MNAKKQKEIMKIIVAETNPLNEYNVLNFNNLVPQDYSIIASAMVKLMWRQPQLQVSQVGDLILAALSAENNLKN